MGPQGRVPLKKIPVYVCVSVSGVKESFQEQVTLKLRLQWCRNQPGAGQGNECHVQR